MGHEGMLLSAIPVHRGANIVDCIGQVDRVQASQVLLSALIKVRGIVDILQNLKGGIQRNSRQWIALDDSATKVQSHPQRQLRILGYPDFPVDVRV